MCHFVCVFDTLIAFYYEAIDRDHLLLCLKVVGIFAQFLLLVALLQFVLRFFLHLTLLCHFGFLFVQRIAGFAVLVFLLLFVFHFHYVSFLVDCCRFVQSHLVSLAVADRYFLYQKVADFVCFVIDHFATDHFVIGHFENLVVPLYFFDR